MAMPDVLAALGGYLSGLLDADVDLQFNARRAPSNGGRVS
jgi:hypothetical protein